MTYWKRVAFILKNIISLPDKKVQDEKEINEKWNDTVPDCFSEVNCCDYIQDLFK